MTRARVCRGRRGAEKFRDNKGEVKQNKNIYLYIILLLHNRLCRWDVFSFWRRAVTRTNESRANVLRVNVWKIIIIIIKLIMITRLLYAAVIRFGCDNMHGVFSVY